jgi:hypothetical protein
MRVLMALVLVFLSCIAALVAMVGVGLWRLGRHNRVSPSVPTAAPLGWLGSPSRAARLHRRLRTVVTTLRALPRDPDGSEPSFSRGPVADDLERHAVALDEWVQWVSRSPARDRARHYDEIARQVREIEVLAIRLSHLTPAAAGPRQRALARQTIDEIGDRIDVLELAHHEVLEVENETGARAVREIEAARQVNQRP